uniref:Uncharacterized protein n=1 Tax=Avena sativa TaxID=4498 RepID=A0ACD6AQ99_AVESA
MSSESTIEEALLVGEEGGDGDVSSGTRVSIDEALAEHAGEFGRWQLRHFVLVSSAWVLEAMHTMVIIFADREPAMWCPAGDGRCGDRCGVEAEAEASGWVWRESSSSSTVAEWGLVCGERYKVALVQALFFVGCMVGAGVFGQLSDSWLGRKGGLQVVCFLNAVFGLLTSMAPNYWVYTALRVLTGLSAGSIGLCAFVLANEPIGPSRRGVAGMSTFYFFSGGTAILAGVAAMFKSSWRLLYVVTSLPSLLYLVAVLPFVSESPRWYLVRGRAGDAMRVLCEIAATNGRRIPDGITLKLDDDDDDEPAADKQQQVAVEASLLDVLRWRTTRVRLVLSVLINLVCALVYYGLTLNVVNLKTDLYVSVVANAMAEMPAFLLTALLIDRFGRKPLSIATMLLSGVFCTIAGSLIVSSGVLRTACGVVGIFGMAATSNLLFVYTSELFPTVVRNSAMGCIAQATQMGAILAPLVVLLGDRLPFAVFGLSGIIGGLLVFYLPETMNMPFYDTMAGLEQGEKTTLDLQVK